MSRPAGVSDKNASRKSARLARRVTSLRRSSKATARTPWSCACGCSADRLCGHQAVLAERDHNPPFRHADLIAFGIDSGQRLGYQAGADIETVRQKFFQLERSLIPSVGWAGAR